LQTNLRNARCGNWMGAVAAISDSAKIEADPFVDEGGVEIGHAAG